MTGGVDAGVVAGFVAAIAFDVLMPVVVALWARRRLGVAWKVVTWGALGFALSQLFTRVPLVQGLQFVLRDELKASPALMAAWVVVLSLTAGLFEETARLWIFRGPLKDFRRWRDAVGYGVGHGGLESALLIGGLAALGLINMFALSALDPSTLRVPPEVVEEVRKAKETFAQVRWWEPLMGAYERAGSMVLHVALSVLVMQCFVRGSLRWYWLAVGCHTVSNALGVGGGLLAQKTLGKTAGIVVAEGALTVFALLGLWVIRRFRPREPEAEGLPSAPAPTST
ncbi:YhfC family intramembrane metalloprotease [Pyxidicoccus xibeiensis]|uniref:YhfC family intramembrane metalloprotease n=1 Tax=Pyxidicoccus xibeiensis TaxID=2906759 RepID=UPI0020A786EB|nr:YhfC family glutamic-type intramembrane protease [Pyxidicoccus xibeiensis]MCP3144400.1 YhfC family intramembrane metalloprotease [Pyxidicoccus xibeiensis]